MNGNRRRFGTSALALALVALSLLLVQPVCAASENHAFSDLCCVVPDDVASSASAAQPLPDLKAAPAIAWHIAPRLSLAVASPVLGAGPPDVAPARQLPYHARSTRILS